MSSFLLYLLCLLTFACSRSRKASDILFSYVNGGGRGPFGLPNPQLYKPQVSVHKKRISSIAYQHMTDQMELSRLLTKKQESFTNVADVGKELEKTSRDAVDPKQVGLLKKLLNSALLASADDLAANAIIGTQQNMRAAIDQHIPSELQEVANKIFIDPALEAYGAAALEGYEKVRHLLAHPSNMKPNKRSIDEINQLGKLPPPTDRKNGLGVKRAALIKGVKIIRSTIDNAMDRREKRRQEETEKICNGMPDCVREFTQSKLEKYDRKVIETMRRELKLSAKFLLDGLACNQGIKCDDVHHLLGLDDLDRTGNNPGGMSRDILIGNAPNLNGLEKNQLN